MNKRVFTILVLLLAFAVVVLAAQEQDAPEVVDQTLFEQGQQLFEANCSVCHQASGRGNPPAIPALAGNQNLGDLPLIVETVHNGRQAMPAFPQFGAEELAAVATYIRNAWENEFGGVAVEAVAAQLGSADGAQEEVALRSVWDGVYTQAQAERGSSVYSSSCSVCHGYIWTTMLEPDLRAMLKPLSSGQLMHISDPTLGPILSGQPFLQDWSEQTVGALFALTRSTMPLDNPSTLSDQAYIDVISFLFASSDVPPGEEELPPDPAVLNNIVIKAAPAE